jgi:hypothetical protein
LFQKGNFFSQERLPLKSCKIKIQLNADLTSLANQQELVGSVQLDQEDLNDLILAKTTKISSLVQIDKNTTQTTQLVETNPNDLDTTLLKNAEIRKFFKSLLHYIPIRNLTRLDEVIKSNEAYLSCLNPSESLAATSSYLR